MKVLKFSMTSVRLQNSLHPRLHVFNMFIYICFCNLVPCLAHGGLESIQICRKVWVGSDVCFECFPQRFDRAKIR
jgi:hypothetical protein